jgi:hypothetical protein
LMTEPIPFAVQKITLLHLLKNIRQIGGDSRKTLKVDQFGRF